MNRDESLTEIGQQQFDSKQGQVFICEISGSHGCEYENDMIQHRVASLK
jgi:hypothetical protein